MVVADKAKAVALYLRSRNASIESQNDAAEIRIRAERRLGELTREIDQRPTRGGRPSKTSRVSREVTKTESLKAAGIKQQDASKWERLAAIPEKRFEKFVEDTRDNFRIDHESVGGNRHRFHGQPRRGSMTVAAKDAMDIRLAIAELTGAHEILMRLDDVQMLPVERRENRRSAGAKIALAGRLVDEVVLGRAKDRKP